MASGQIRRGRRDKRERDPSGKRIERREIGTPGEFDALTDDELERALKSASRGLAWWLASVGADVARGRNPGKRLGVSVGEGTPPGTV
jgi:hypothetical protein